MTTRILYASGPGHIIESHRYWRRGEHNPTEVSFTFSSQIEEFCRQIGASGYLISTHREREILKDGEFVLEHRPKKALKGPFYHVGEVLYGLGLLRTALRFRAQTALIDSGSTHYFVLLLFRLFGIKVVPILHNTLWAAGFPPQRLIPRIVLWMDSLFWRWGPAAVIAVSPECARQVEGLKGRADYPIVQVRAQLGRINRIKGIFDILEIARKIEDGNPGLVAWEICGTGVDFEEFKARHANLRLAGIVELRGWTSLEDLVEVYSRTHACIVPTRSSFIEGLAMTAAEAILAGRPLITNPVVPALEVLSSACVAAKTDDPESHLQAVVKLATDADLYKRLQRACAEYQHQFYDRSYGLTEVLGRTLRT